MTRDDDYTRALLLEAEASDSPFIHATDALNPSPEDLKRRAHAEWLADAGLFARENRQTYRLTNQGQDYLAAIRDEGIWAMTKDAAGALGGVTLGMMKELALGYLKQEAAARLGIQLE